LVYERYLNGVFQVRIPEFIETILSYVTTAHGGACAPEEGTSIRPNAVFVVLNEYPENLYASFKWDSKGYVVEHAKPRR
jgi:hypothetical protein